MFGLSRKGKLYNGTTKEMKFSTGYNVQLKQYFIRITDRKSKVTCRVNLTEEEYHNFWNGANFTANLHDDKSYKWHSVP